MDLLTALWGWFGGQQAGAGSAPFAGIAGVRGASITVPSVGAVVLTTPRVSAVALTAPTIANVEVLPA